MICIARNDGSVLVQIYHAHSEVQCAVRLAGEQRRGGPNLPEKCKEMIHLSFFFKHSSVFFK